MGEIALSVSGHKKERPILLSGELMASAIQPYLFPTPTESAPLLADFLVKKKDR